MRVRKGDILKRVLCIVSSLDTGGAETFMMKIFRSLPKNYKLDFIVSTSSGYYEEEVKELGGKIFRIPLRTEHPFKTFKEIKRVVKNNNYEIVLKLCDTPIGIFDILASKMGGAKKICVRSCNASSSESKLKHIFFKILRPVFNKLIDVKIAPSILAAEYTFGKKIVEKDEVYFLHNAVDLDVYYYSEEGRKKVREEFSIDSEQLVIGHIGRFNNQKNHSFLLDVFKEINKCNPSSLLILVGNGENKQQIVSKIKKLGLDDSVMLTGIRSDVTDLLSAMDVFVFPSFYEGMPNTIIEAQATGLPCVLSDSITKEAKITNLLHYLSLNKTSKEWCEIALNSKVEMRKQPRDNFISNRYDMESIVKEFIEIVF